MKEKLVPIPCIYRKGETCSMKGDNICPYLTKGGKCAPAIQSKESKTHGNT